MKTSSLRILQNNNSSAVLNAIIFTVLIFMLSCESRGVQDTSTDSDNETAEAYTVVEEVPSFDGGWEAFYNYIRSEIRYPIEARERGVEGRVEVQLVVERDGSISNVEVVSGIGSGCDAEAIRVVESVESINPGVQRGRTVRVQMLLPIVFELDKEKKNEDNSPQGIVIIEKIEINGDSIKVEAAYADGVWTGTVYSPGGDVLPGANIVIEGTTRGTVADLDGSFSIEASEAEKLVVSFVGYKSSNFGHE